MLNMSINDINIYLIDVGWSGSRLNNWDVYEQKNWNKHDTLESAYEWFKKHRNAMFRSIKAEFEAKQTIGVCYCGKCNKCMYG